MQKKKNQVILEKYTLSTNSLLLITIYKALWKYLFLMNKAISGHF